MKKTDLYLILTGVIVGVALFAIALCPRDNDATLMSVGECVETMAGIEKVDGTAQEKWDLFAEYCASQTK